MTGKNETVREVEKALYPTNKGVADGFDFTKKPRARERSVEKYLNDKIHSIGGKCYKFVSPGYNGMPDRIAVCRGRIMFIEVKRPGEKPRKLQRARHLELKALGAQTMVVSTKEEVDYAINCLNMKGHCND